MFEDVATALENKRAKLEIELARMSAPPTDPSGISFGKRVGDGTSIAVERLVQVDAHQQLQVVLADVNRALSKIEEDSYGTCDRCGAAILPERLEVLPWAVLCVGCADRGRLSAQ